MFSVIAVHGLYTYHIYFADLMKYFKTKGVEVKTYDLIGFGKTTSTGRGDIESANVFIFQLVNLILEMKKTHPDHKIVVIGENIGGLIGLLTAARTEKLIDVLIAVNPVTDAHYSFDKAGSVGHMVGGMFNPDKPIEIKIAPENICNDDHMKEILAKDEFRLHHITFRFWMALTKAATELKKEAGKVRVPTLVQVSRSGKCVPVEITKEMFYSLGTRQKHFQVLDVPDAMCICKEREQVFEKQLKFINNMLNPPPPSELSKMPEINPASGDKK